jgi:multidrug efflux pump subunit AcrA (membrane-fusion protein)
MEAVITVDAYPSRPFEGHVLKIEPQATVVQNVTMFPALVRIANPGHLLMPGMNAEVNIQIGTRENVLAIPYAALRTPRDVASAATVLGLDPDAVQASLKEQSQAPPHRRTPTPRKRWQKRTHRKCGRPLVVTGHGVLPGPQEDPRAVGRTWVAVLGHARGPPAAGSSYSRCATASRKRSTSHRPD